MSMSDDDADGEAEGEEGLLEEGEGRERVGVREHQVDSKEEVAEPPPSQVPQPSHNPIVHD